MKCRLSFLLFVAVVAFLSTGCSSPSKDSNIPDNAINPDVINNPTTASGNSKDNVPVFQFTDTLHGFGEIMQGEKVSYAFRFKNVGKGDLVIRSANGSCGCTVPEWPKDPVRPGGEGIINVTFNSEGREGEQHKTVTLIANTMPANTILTITGNVLKPENQ